MSIINKKSLLYLHVANLNNKKRLLIAALFAVILLSVLVIILKFYERQVLINELDSLSERLDISSDNAKSINTQKIEKESHDIESVLIQLPADRKLEPLLTELYYLADKNQLLFKSLEISTEEIILTNSKLNKISILWNIEGKFSDFKKMLEGLNDLDRLLLVSSVNFNKIIDNHESKRGNISELKVNTDINIEIFYDNLLYSEGRNESAVEELFRSGKLIQYSTFRSVLMS